MRRETGLSYTLKQLMELLSKKFNKVFLSGKRRVPVDSNLTKVICKQITSCK